MNQSSSKETECSVMDYFELFREKIVHEDDLINNRTNWLLGVQGLLFTAYGILLKTSTPSIENVNPVVTTDILVSTIPVVGVLISVATILSVLGAVITMMQTTMKWKDWIDGGSRQAEKAKCPRVMTSWFPATIGFVSTFGIPILFIWAWTEMS